MVLILAVSVGLRWGLISRMAGLAGVTFERVGVLESLVDGFLVALFTLFVVDGGEYVGLCTRSFCSPSGGYRMLVVVS
jgi:hypothetical protein